MEITEIKYGGHYLWNHSLRGGYGYSELIPVICCGIGKTMVMITVPLKSGKFKNVWVLPKNLKNNEK
jgi:hypothetical protein